MIAPTTTADLQEQIDELRDRLKILEVRTARLGPRHLPTEKDYISAFNKIQIKKPTT